MLSRFLCAIFALFAVCLISFAGVSPATAQSTAPTAQPEPAPAQPAQPGQSQPQATSLPPGVKHIYALQGDNSMIVLADQEGFDTVRDLLRNLTGVVDVIKTRFDEVELDEAEQAKLGVKIDPDSPILKPADEAIVLDAWNHDRLTPATYPLRVVAQENTCTDIMLTDHVKRAKTPITYVPRVAKDGSMVVEFVEPLSLMAKAPSGDTVVIALPGRAPNTVRLMFVMQTDVGRA